MRNTNFKRKLLKLRCHYEIKNNISNMKSPLEYYLPTTKKNFRTLDLVRLVLNKGRQMGIKTGLAYRNSVFFFKYK